MSEKHYHKSTVAGFFTEPLKPNTGKPCENSLKTHLIVPLFFQGECDPKRFDVRSWYEAAKDMLSCDSHGSVHVEAHIMKLCSFCPNTCHKSRGERVQHRVVEQVVDVPVLWFMEEIVKLVTGEVVCNACTGVRRQHGWTCTY